MSRKRAAAGYPRTVPWPIPRRTVRHWSSVASAVLLTAAVAGCGNTDSWVETTPAEGWPAQYGDAANSSYRPTRGRGPADSALDPLGERVPGVSGGAQLAQLARGERADTGRLLADGVGERRQRPAAVVHTALPGRRAGQPVVRRLRQPLRRPARGDCVLSSHPVDPLAAPGDGNAFHAKDSRSRTTSRSHAPGTGAGIRQPSGHRRRQFGRPGGQRRPQRLHPWALRLRAGPGGLPDRRRTRIRASERDDRGGSVGTRRPHVSAGRAEVPPGSKPASDPGVDQQRGRRRRPGQPGGVQRRIHHLRQWA